jgi:PAS domain S-box-containing protein
MIAVAVAWFTFSPPLLSFILIAAIMIVYWYGLRRAVVPIVAATVFSFLTAPPGTPMWTRLPFLVTMVGITLLVGYIKNLNFRLQTMAWVVDSSTDAIIGKDLNGIIQSWNKGAENMLGWTEKEVLGKDINLTIPDSLSFEEVSLRARVSRGLSTNLETSRLTKTGKLITVSLSAFPTKNQYGKIVGISTIMRDVTEARHASSIAEAQFKGTPVPIFSWKKVENDFELVDYNTAGIEITDGKIEGLRGVKATDLYKDHPEVLDLLNQSFNTRSTVRREGPFKFITTGKEHYLDASFVFVPPDLVMLHSEDITARKMNEEIIRKGREQFRTIIENAPNGMVVVNRSGEITMVNSHLETIFGYKREEIIGKPIEILIPEQARDSHKKDRQRFTEAPEARPMGKGRDLFGRRKDGSLFPVEVGLNPIETSEGTLVLGTVVDITERKQYELRLKSAMEEAEQANKTKDEFLAVVSHELKTPLSSILGYSSLLASGKLGTNTEAAKLALSTIERSARNQASLIEDLLDVSRIVSGKIQIKKLIIGIPGIVQQACEAFRPAAVEKEVSLTCSEITGKLFVTGDPSRLQQILSNIIDNAIKFTPKGGEVCVSVVPKGLRVNIVIKDSGIGIEPEFMKVIFQRFKQESSGIRRQGQGLGLGLSIAKSLAELQGGAIEVHSEGRGKGSTFTVVLPLSSPPVEGTVVKGVAQEARDSLTGLSILAIDDDRDTLDMLKLALERYGASVLTAESAEEGKSKREEHKVDIIVCDIGMPLVSGYEFIKGLRAEGVSTPALALTAFSGEEYAKLALEAGFNHYLAKPIEIGHLIEGISYCLSVVDKP